MPARKPDAEKYCEACGARMHRYRMPSALESHAQFALRRFCSEECRRSAPKKHGTEWGYDRGCRCDECRAAKRDMGRRRRLRRRGVDPGQVTHGALAGYEAGCRCPDCLSAKGVTHGTTTGYGWHGCRCAACREAVRVDARERSRVRRGGAVPSHVAHGTANAVNNYGCKCDACRDFANQVNSDHRAQTNARLREAAARHGQVWTGRELETLANTDLTESQVGAALGRSLYAIRSARERLRRDPDAVRRGGFTTGS